MPKSQKIYNTLTLVNHKGKLIKNNSANRQRVQKKLEQLDRERAELLRELPNAYPVAEVKKPKQYSYNIVFYAEIEKKTTKTKNGQIINIGAQSYYPFTKLGRYTLGFIPEGNYLSNGERVYTNNDTVLITNGELEQAINTYYPDLITVSDRKEITPLSIKQGKKQRIEQLLHNSTTHKSINNKFMLIEKEKNNNELKFKDPVNVILQDGCWYNVILSVWETPFNKYYKNEVLSVELLRTIFEADNNTNGVSIEQALKFFKRYSLFVVIYNVHLQLIEEYIPEKQNKNLNYRGIRVISHNQHIYLQNNNLKSLEQKEVSTDNYELTNKMKTTKEAIEVKDEDIEDVKKTNTLEDILLTILLATKNTAIYHIDELESVLHHFVYKLGITPTIIGDKHRVKNIILNYNIVVEEEEKSIFINIHNFTGIKFSKSEEEVLNITDTQLRLYLKNSRELMNCLKTNKYCSNYSKDLITLLGDHMKTPLVSPLVILNKKNLKKKYSILDFNKSYACILSQMTDLPQFRLFDKMEIYNNEPIDNTTIYLVEIVGEIDKMEDIFLFKGKKKDTMLDCIYDEDFVEDLLTNENSIREDRKALFSGYDLNKIMPHLKTKIVIRQFIKPYNTYKNPISKKVISILEDKEQAICLKKFLVNKFIGSIGTKTNRKCFSLLSTNEHDLQSELLETYKDLPDFNKSTIFNLNTEEEPIYYTAIKKEKGLVNGFYPIQWLIYSHQRINLYILYLSMVKNGIKPVSVKVDCIYFDYKKTTEEQKKMIERCVSNELGGFKIEHNKSL